MKTLLILVTLSITTNVFASSLECSSKQDGGALYTYINYTIELKQQSKEVAAGSVRMRGLLGMPLQMQAVVTNETLKMYNVKNTDEGSVDYREVATLKINKDGSTTTISTDVDDEFLDLICILHK